MGKRSYGRFYLLLKSLPGADKETLVEQFTNGRTEHLHLMTEDEYNRMCNAMEEASGFVVRKAAMQKEMKKKRSICLHLMQLLGVNTADWSQIDNFCMNPRIAGKRFARLSLEELENIQVKLRMIKKHGGLKREPLQSQGMQDEQSQANGHYRGIKNKQYFLLINTTDYGKEN